MNDDHQQITEWTTRVSERSQELALNNAAIRSPTGAIAAHSTYALMAEVAAALRALDAPRPE